MVLFILTLKQTSVTALNNQDKVKRRAKITYIILESDQTKINYILKNLKPILFFFAKHDIIVVSNKKKSMNDNKITTVSSLAKAIQSSTGNYLCFIDNGEILKRSGVNKISEIISKTNCDMYFSNYTDVNGDLVDICNQVSGYDYSKAVLPKNTALGLKIISRELAIKVRLPKDGLYEYINEASDKARDVHFIINPVVQNNLEISKSNEKLLDFAQSQIRTLDRRYYYGSIKSSNKVKKVLFIAPWVVIGGAEKVLFDLSTEFIKKNIKVDIFCTHKEGEWKDKFEKVGVKIHVSKKNSIKDKINEIDVLVRKNLYDVIHTSNTEYGYYYSPKLKYLPYKPVFIDTIHSQNNPLSEISSHYQAYIDKVITVNSTIKKLFVDKFVPEKMTAVLNGVDVSRYKVRSCDSRYDNKKLTFLGRISEEKNPLQFIKIAEKLSQKHPDWKYEVVGDGPMLKNMKAAAIKAGLKDKIVFLGFISEGSSKLIDSSCCVITSHTEGLPIVLLESLSMGVPVVSSNVGGIHEILSDGDNGYLVDSSDDTDLYVEKIEKLMYSYDEYEKISKSAVNSTLNYTAAKMAENTLDVYVQAMELNKNKFSKKTTIAMLSYNRTDAIERTLDTIYKNTDVPFDVLVLDNGSEKDTIDFLKKFNKRHSNFKVVFEKKNLGCPGGRHKMLKMIKSDYIVTIDNDMEVPKYWLRDLIIRMEEDEKIMGVCVKDIFPWGKIEFTGGSIAKDENGFYLFNAVNYNKDYNDLSTLEEMECDWLPGGATLWRGSVRDIAEHSLEYVNAFEDFDYSLQLVEKGYRTVNCPSVMFIHHHSSGFGKKQQSKEVKYISDRNNENGFILSLAAFFRRTGYVMRNDKIYSLLNIKEGATPKEVKRIVEDKASEIKSQN